MALLTLTPLGKGPFADEKILDALDATDTPAHEDKLTPPDPPADE